MFLHPNAEHTFLAALVLEHSLLSLFSSCAMLVSLLASFFFFLSQAWMVEVRVSLSLPPQLQFAPFRSRSQCKDLVCPTVHQFLPFPHFHPVSISFFSSRSKAVNSCAIHILSILYSTSVLSYSASSILLFSAASSSNLWCHTS